MNSIVNAFGSAQRVLIVHERFAPDYKGGGEYFVLEQAKHLQRAGIDVRVLTTGNPEITSFDGIATERLAISPYRLNLATKEVERAAQGVDLIHCYTYHSILPSIKAGEKLGIPVVIGVLAYFGGTWHEMKGNLLGRLWQCLERYLIGQRAAARIFISDYSLQKAIGEGIVGQEFSHVLEPGITIDDYYSHDEKPYVVFSAKLETRKGINEVLQAAEQLPHIPFKILGWGDSFDYFKKSAPSNVEVIPFTGRAQLADYLAKAKIFVFPSKAETFGLVVAEAMASGCAIVSTVDLPFEGVKLETVSSPELINAVQALWNNDGRCLEAGMVNQATAKRYCWNEHCQKLINLYNNVTQVNKGVENVL